MTHITKLFTEAPLVAIAGVDLLEAKASADRLVQFTDVNLFRDGSTDPTQKKTIVVWFSCGACSAVALLKTIEKYSGTHIIRAVYNPLAEEDSDNLRFLADIQKLSGLTIELAVNSKWPSASAEEVWEKKAYMAGIKGAPCTGVLKKQARQQWEAANEWEYLVLGFPKGEEKRHETFVLTERENSLPVLIDAGLTKQDCAEYLQKLGVSLPRVYALGFPNANCIGCVKATSPTYWNLVREHFPEVFDRRVTQSNRLNVRLTRVKGVRLHLRDLKPTDKGQSLKSLKKTVTDCGIFCEEKF